MTYREPPAGEAVIVCMGKALVALERDSGKIRWCAVGQYDIDRIFRMGDNVLAVGGKAVLCVNAATGSIVGSVPLDFIPETALVCGEDLVLVAGTGGFDTVKTRALSLGPDGAIRWRVVAKMESTGLLTANTLLQSLDPHGGVSTEARIPMTSYRAGILYGGDVAQPDQIGRE